MKRLADILVGLVALEHIWFLVLEMFFWTKSLGLETFGITAEFAQQSASLAANQGLYNGFLAAGLIWGLLKKQDAFAIKVFFLSCVVIAGVFGAVTAKTSILYVQGVPAMFALGLLLLTNRE